MWYRSNYIQYVSFTMPSPLFKINLAKPADLGTQTEAGDAQREEHENVTDGWRYAAVVSQLYTSLSL